MPYTKMMSSAKPGLIIFLIDQSGSMSDDFGVSESKADFATKAVNRAINELILTNADGATIKDRCFLSLIGYGQSVAELRSDYLNALADSPIRINKVKKKVSDGAGGLVEIEDEMPIWFESVAENGTPMSEALEIAFDLCQKWIQQKPDHPVPIVLNISDGMPNDKSTALASAQKVMNLSCADGNILLLNVHITKGGVPLTFPNSDMNLHNDHSKLLYNMSSTIPQEYFGAAEKAGLPVVTGSKGFIFNADAELLIKFIQFGSSKKDVTS